MGEARACGKMLQTTGPITGTVLGMGYCNDLDLVQKLAIDDRERILAQYEALRAVKVCRI